MAAEPKSNQKPGAADTEPDRESSIDDLDPKHRAQLMTWMSQYVTKKAEIDELESDLETLKLEKISSNRCRRPLAGR